jgi:hypothetical protein
VARAFLAFLNFVAVYQFALLTVERRFLIEEREKLAAAAAASQQQT